MLSKIHNILAFIIGSSRVIGQQIAVGLCQLGANVIIHGRIYNNVSKTLELIKRFPVEKHVDEGDLSSNSDISKITNFILKQFGGIDILYNNAAVMNSFEKNIWNHSIAAWTDTFQVNVMAIYYMCATFIPGIIERGYSRVINLTSGIKDQPELLPCSISKAPIDKLTEDIAFKLKGTGVRINSLNPGWLKTDMGGPEAWYPVDHILPGALILALIDDDGTNGEYFSAIELRNIQL
jgi:NAD(P)-dependent dehydrogenase (short-subunit alcohol dehydrogenase family)